MGSLNEESGRSADETQHRVTISQGFWLGKYPVTQVQWKAVMGSNPSHFTGSNLPVECVSWDAISEPGGFMEKANHFAAVSEIFFLPTEAQWEYACGAGVTTSLNNGKNLMPNDWVCPNLDEIAWYHENSGNETHPVGQKKANGWGLHDMHGNVFEWCMDWHDVYTDAAQVDPQGPDLGSGRVIRGGSWLGDAYWCHVAAHCLNFDNPASTSSDCGFRIARSSGPSRVPKCEDVEA